MSDIEAVELDPSARVMRTAHLARLRVLEAGLAEIFGPEHAVVTATRERGRKVLADHDANVQAGLASGTALRGAVRRAEDVSVIDVKGVSAEERAHPDFVDKVAKFEKVTRTLFGQFDRIGAQETAQLFALNPRAEVRAAGSNPDGAIASRQFPAFVGSIMSTVLNAVTVHRRVPQSGSAARQMRRAGGQGVREVKNAARRTG